MRRNLFSLIIASVVLMTTAISASAQLTAQQAFASIPDRLMPLLDKNTRLDMIDYFNSGSSKASKNAMAGKSRITAITPEHVMIELTGASTCEIAVLPAGNDTLIAVINTVSTPAPDSKLRVYSSDWANELTDKVFTSPVLQDWLTDDGKKNLAEVETMVPFMLAGGTFEPQGPTYVLTNKVSEFLTDEVYKPMANYFKPSLSYRWNGKKFVR